MTMNVGMIGLGIMGSAISGNLLKKGISVNGYDVLQERIEELQGKGGTGASSSREVAQNNDIVITLLASVSAFEDVIWGTDGILASGHKDLIVIEAGTLPLENKRKAYHALDEAGMILIDCTLSGTGAQALTGDLAVYGSGNQTAYDKCVPIFNGFARSHYFLGEFGNGSKMKYVANLLVAIHNVAAAEAFVMGMKAGLDPELIYKVISDGAGTSRMFEMRGPLMAKNEYDDATMKNDVWQKDLKIISNFARDMNCPTPLFSSSVQAYLATMAQGRDKQDTASVCAVLEDWAHFKRDSV